MISIRGGTVLTMQGWVSADVLIDRDRIVGLEGGGERLEGDSVIDAAGCLVGPGLVDLHTHLREPGQTWKEDVASGSRAAAAGGFTAVVAMPNTEPPIDSPKVVEYVVALGEEVDLVDVVPAATLTLARAGTAPSDIVALYDAGVRIFTDDGDSVADEEVMERVMEIVARLPGAVVSQHAEDRSITFGGHMHEGATSRRLGVGGLPSAAEEDVVRRDIGLVRRTGARYHCQHVSSRRTIDLIRDAKRAGLPVTAEVTPHHLTFDETYLEGLDPSFKMYPPLRSEQDRLHLIGGLADGTIDAVATDHAPHQREEKAVAFDKAPRGVIGLETAAAAVWEALGDRDRMFDALSSAPASIAGLSDQGRPLAPGGVANVVVFDPAMEWTVSSFHSKSANSPYLGRKMQGKVRATIRRGRLSYQDGVG
ncbi:MAG: dihydroorotase [Acidimicrobiia bacterium]